MFAQKALDFAQLFALSFGDAPLVSGQTTYKIEMSAPEGQSTGGGVQGVQHITLVPQGGGASVVAGSANRSSMTAQLRTFALLREIHDRRAPGTAFALDAGAYKSLLERLGEFLKNQGMTLKEEDAAPGSAPVAAPGKPFPMTLVLAATVAVLTLGIAIWFLTNRPN
jgi:hypothetical protein